MKVVVIGGVAAGTKVAAKLKREDGSAEVLILTKGSDISYAGCGLPYYLGGFIETRQELVVNTPETFEALTGAQVRTGIEVTAVNTDEKYVKARNTETGEELTETYDKLVIASGASSWAPEVSGLDLKNVFFMKTPDDAVSLRQKIDAGEIRRVIVVGGGLIGLEVAENIAAREVRVSVIEYAHHVLSGIMDPEFSEYIEHVIADNGVIPFLDCGLTGLEGEDGKVTKVITTKRPMKTDAVVLAMGMRPNTAFLEGSGIEMLKGTILVDESSRTNVPDIYAVGDCAMVVNRITGNRQWSAMGSTANIAGRSAALNIAGESSIYAGVLGTGVAKLPGVEIGRTGLSESEAIASGYDVETVLIGTDDKAHYYPGSAKCFIKLICDKSSGKLLGLQTAGNDKVDKFVDIAVTAISLGATIDQLQNLDLAYAPPFSTAIHPFSVAVNVLINKLEGKVITMTPREFAEGKAEGYKMVDCSIVKTINNLPYLDFTKVDGPVDGLETGEKILLICSTGKRTYLAQNVLKKYGYSNTYVLEGGTLFNKKVLED